MSIAQVLQQAVKKLKSRDIISAELDAELLLAEAISRPREYVLAHPEQKLTVKQAAKFKALLKRRQSYEPIAHILGRKEFFGLEFKVNKNVLIPRPETETLCELALDYISQNKIKKIIDVGTGSGAIALAIKKSLPQAEVLAVDDSAPALFLARQNVKRHKYNIKFLKSDLVKNIPDHWLAGSVIVTNLPYLDRATIKKYSKSLKKQLAHEPPGALFAASHGTAAYAELFRQLTIRPIKPRAVFCEIGPCHWQEYYKVAEKYFPASAIKIKQDLAGKKRVLVIDLSVI